jgi:hypothetical protein
MRLLRDSGLRRCEPGPASAAGATAFPRHRRMMACMEATTIQLLQVTLQALSAFAIAGGLLFTAIQFRAARRAQAVANFAKIVELQFQLRKMRVENPALAAVSKLDVSHLRSDREIQEYFLQLMQLSLFEIAWYAHSQGQLPDDYFRSWSNRMKQLGGEESFRNMLSTPSVKIMHDGFDAYVRQLLK